LLPGDVGGEERFVPFRKPIVRRVDRAARVIELDPPEGLLEL
jgi:ribosomal 30S subunit maturation factor RimM